MFPPPFSSKPATSLLRSLSFLTTSSDLTWSSHWITCRLAFLPTPVCLRTSKASSRNRTTGPRMVDPDVSTAITNSSTIPESDCSRESIRGRFP